MDGSELAAWGNDPLWYQDAIIYELPVRAFFDDSVLEMLEHQRLDRRSL